MHNTGVKLYKIFGWRICGILRWENEVLKWGMRILGRPNKDIKVAVKDILGREETH